MSRPRRSLGPVIAYMLTLLEGGLTWLDTLSIPASAERQAAIKQSFLTAQDILHKRLHAHGVKH